MKKQKNKTKTMKEFPATELKFQKYKSVDFFKPSKIFFNECQIIVLQYWKITTPRSISATTFVKAILFIFVFKNTQE